MTQVQHTPYLQVENISKSFGENKAVQGVSFSVNPGELVGFMGPNGAGKSTTMRLIAGFLKPDEGQVFINGIDMINRQTEAQQHLGYLPEQSGTFNHGTVREYLTFLGRAYVIEDIEEAIRVSSDMTRCDHVLDWPVENLSKGLRQRVFFAGALMHDPKVLVLDEPTDGLDPNQKHEMRLVLKELAKNKAVLVSTHILEEAEAICTRSIIIGNGQVVMDTTPEELKQQGGGDIQVAFRVLTTNRGFSKQQREKP